MPKRKKTKSKAKKNEPKNNIGLAKIATITTKSLSNAFVNFKKKTRTKKNKRNKI
tara:strand:+ start:32 stop:196 length:165 start_codon:yes stop_codon:yes gene_type:complete